MEIRIDSTCPVPWEKMRGDHRTRFCPHCHHRVYNVVSLKKAEVREMLLKLTGRACERIYRRRDGTVMTRECGGGWENREIAKIALTILGVLLLLLTLGSAGRSDGFLPDTIREFLEDRGILD